MFLLCRLDPSGAVDPAALTRRIQRTLRPHRTVVHVLEEVRASATSTETRPRALLRVQIRTPDRPGVMQDLLRELARQVHREAYAGADRTRRAAALPRGSADRERTGVDGAGAVGAATGALQLARPRHELPLVGNGGEPKVDVLYALTPVVDGQALSGRLLLRLPYHHRGNDHWVDVDWQDIGRVVAQAVTRGSDGGRTFAAAERSPSTWCAARPRRSRPRPAQRAGETGRLGGPGAACRWAISHDRRDGGRPGTSELARVHPASPWVSAPTSW